MLAVCQTKETFLSANFALLYIVCAFLVMFFLLLLLSLKALKLTVILMASACIKYQESVSQSHIVFKTIFWILCKQQDQCMN